MTDTSNGYLPLVIELLNKIETEQLDNIKTAAKLMADAIEDDRLINVYGGGGHTTPRRRDVLPRRRPVQHQPLHGDRSFGFQPGAEVPVP